MFSQPASNDDLKLVETRTVHFAWVLNQTYLVLSFWENKKTPPRLLVFTNLFNFFLCLNSFIHIHVRTKIPLSIILIVSKSLLERLPRNTLKLVNQIKPTHPSEKLYLRYSHLFFRSLFQAFGWWSAASLFFLLTLLCAVSTYDLNAWNRLMFYLWVHVRHIHRFWA